MSVSTTNQSPDTGDPRTVRRDVDGRIDRESTTCGTRSPVRVAAISASWRRSAKAFTLGALDGEPRATVEHAATHACRSKDLSRPADERAGRRGGRLSPASTDAQHCPGGRHAKRSSVAYGAYMNDPLTLVAEIARLRSLGYDADMSVTPEGNVRCSPCGHVVEPSRAAVETTARFEGASNPDDQSIVFGIHCLGCGTRGVLVAA